MAFGKFEGGTVIEMPLGGHEKKEGEESSALEADQHGLNTEQFTRFAWLLNQGPLGSLQGFEDRIVDIREYPEDYQNYNEEEARKLLTKLKFLEAKSDEFSNAVKALEKMMQ